jgi:hypothetical protein
VGEHWKSTEGKKEKPYLKKKLGQWHRKRKYFSTYHPAAQSGCEGVESPLHRSKKVKDRIQPKQTRNLNSLHRPSFGKITHVTSQQTTRVL